MLEKRHGCRSPRGGIVPASGQSVKVIRRTPKCEPLARRRRAEADLTRTLTIGPTWRIALSFPVKTSLPAAIQARSASEGHRREAVVAGRKLAPSIQFLCLPLTPLLPVDYAGVDDWQAKTRLLRGVSTGAGLHCASGATA